MTQEEAMQILTDMGLHEGGMDNWVPDNAWWKFAKLVAQHEREACAKIVEESSLPDTYSQECLPEIASDIRARGQA
jgi:hypothetical protein